MKTVLPGQETDQAFRPKGLAAMKAFIIERQRNERNERIGLIGTAYRVMHAFMYTST